MAMDLSTTTELFTLFSDATRVRLLAVLAEHELTVAELVKVTQGTQSRVSTHLGRLKDAGLVVVRREGTSTFYRLAQGGLPEHARVLWATVKDSLKDDAVASDLVRCQAVLKARSRGAGGLEAWAGEMEKHYSPGRTWEALARGLLGLCRLGDVLDAGSGDGTLAQMLAPHARSITLLDQSARMLEAARRRLKQEKHVHFKQGDVEKLPFPANRFDEVVLFNVLTDVPSPPAALAQCARVLRRGGRLAIITLDSHHHAQVLTQWQHRHRGFRASALETMLRKAGFDVDQCAVTSREKNPPHLQVITAFAHL
jgi:ArsR family transcriptional regulator